MIRVILLGRTGNNFFQYAAGRMLAEKHGVPLALDASWFNEASWRSASCLRNLPLKAEIVRPFSAGSRVLKKLTGYHHWEFLQAPFYQELADDLTYDPKVSGLPGDCTLSGYFQTPLYFAQIEGKLREEISFGSRILDHESGNLAAAMSGCESVAIHVRRTDYVGNPNVAVCDEDYYLRAIARMRELVDSPRFFVFSDDPEWGRGFFSDPGFEIVDCAVSRHDALNDLHLMSLAKHHIIANSSYSWWAAWIGKKPEQRVIMPSRWFIGIRSPIAEKQCEGWEII